MTIIIDNKMTDPVTPQALQEFEEFKHLRGGTGSFKWNNCEYEGQWHEGKFHGTGKLSFSEKSYYDGEFENGKYSGEGVRRYGNGDAYIGQWEAGKQSGSGLFLWAGKHEVYQGQWADGMPNGEGLYVWYDAPLDPVEEADLQTFVQARLDQYARQEVTLQNPQVMHYDGAFRAGKRHGHGTFHYASGDRLEGDWVDDVKEGQFELVARDDSTATVWFEHDVETGREPPAMPAKAGNASARPDENRAVSCEGDAVHYVALVSDAAEDALQRLYGTQLRRMTRAEAATLVSDVRNSFIRAVPRLSAAFVGLVQLRREAFPPQTPPLPSFSAITPYVEMWLAQHGMFGLDAPASPMGTVRMFAHHALSVALTAIAARFRAQPSLVDAVNVGLEQLCKHVDDTPVFSWLKRVDLIGLAERLDPKVGLELRSVTADAIADVGVEQTPELLRAVSRAALEFLGAEGSDSAAITVLTLPGGLCQAVLAYGLAIGGGELPKPEEFDEWMHGRPLGSL
ncbi:MORN repeat [Carpediemonas membranifera]|uniref:MORN repeat n=1 Tax=Carpediemonas membranifera TaxID=201153 RepID=A0A8J6E336_9EUKA|nr:MORN repeat [Carpediemonas membranifera]|eukprot:KAG9395096.1 MORN repeat [Carpediemonas membranifera]